MSHCYVSKHDITSPITLSVCVNSSDVHPTSWRTIAAHYIVQRRVQWCVWSSSKDHLCFYDLFHNPWDYHHFHFIFNVDEITIIVDAGICGYVFILITLRFSDFIYVWSLIVISNIILLRRYCRLRQVLLWCDAVISTYYLIVLFITSLM